MNGIDVSQWQGYIDFTAVKNAGIEFVYIKASEGTEFTDPFFYRNYANAARAGLPVGFYHYLTARSADAARAEAAHFVAVTEGLSPAGKMVMDIEDMRGMSREEVNDAARAFLEGVEAYSNQPAAIYADAYFAERVLDADLAEYPLWIAQYNVGEPTADTPWRRPAGWQYTDMGRVAGIQGNVDRDIFGEEMQNGGAAPVKRTGDRPADRPADREMRYRVQPGDTLYEIAERFGTSVPVLVRMNRMKNPGLLYPGQLIKLPGQL